MERHRRRETSRRRLCRHAFPTSRQDRRRVRALSDPTHLLRYPEGNSRHIEAVQATHVGPLDSAGLVSGACRVLCTLAMQHLIVAQTSAINSRYIGRRSRGSPYCTLLASPGFQALSAIVCPRNFPARERGPDSAMTDGTASSQDLYSARLLPV